jgi:hypothetical protein
MNNDKPKILILGFEPGVSYHDIWSHTSRGKSMVFGMLKGLEAEGLVELVYDIEAYEPNFDKLEERCTQFWFDEATNLQESFDMHTPLTYNSLRKPKPYYRQKERY